MNPVKIIRNYGVIGTLKKVRRRFLARIFDVYHQARTSGAPVFINPSEHDWQVIETALKGMGVVVESFTPDSSDFQQFQAAHYFPADYHGGTDGEVWDEKLLEHWIASKLLGLTTYSSDQVYLDIAAGGSPWAKALRERLGMTAYALDLSISSAFGDLSYYVETDATATTFADASVDGASLQCAYEMFMRDDDIRLIDELRRILKPGGKAVIVPLYMHTHYCAYATPDCFGKGYPDPGAKEYVFRKWRGVPSARFYDARHLVTRLLQHIESSGMKYRLLALRNKAELGRNIYCHFILEITK